MKVRMLRTVTVTSPRSTYKAGQVYEIAADVAKGWAAAGMCEMDKMEDPALETKAGEPGEGVAAPKAVKPRTTKTAVRPTGD